MTCVRISVFYIFAFSILCEVQVNGQDNPTPKVEALYPKGFRVTLEDDGYTFFGFRGNINKRFEEINEGDIKKDILNKKGGKWVYTNRDVTLKIGDTIYYWLYVRQGRKGRMFTDLDYTVTGFVNEDGTPANTESVTPPIWTRTPDPSESIDIRYNPNAQNCTVSKTVVQGQKDICKETLIFHEEFTKANLKELTMWESLIQFPEEPDYPFNVYIPDKTLSLEDGSLVIAPILTESESQTLYQPLDLSIRCTGKIGTSECRREGAGAQILPPATTAKITTRRSFNFKYGRVEVRAKLPSGSWIIPEINLESTDNTYGSNKYASGLMRVAFVRGNVALAKKLYGGPVLTDSGPYRTLLLQEKIGIENWYKDFHNYTMIWRPDGMDLLVDGEQYGTINPGGGFFEEAKKNNVLHASYWSGGSVMAPLDQMFHLTLGLRVGGVNDFSDDVEGKPWRNSASKAMLNFWRAKDTWYPTWNDGAMKIDYVRVYAL